MMQDADELIAAMLAVAPDADALQRLADLSDSGDADDADDPE
jgi:hypothetical protein